MGRTKVLGSLLGALITLSAVALPLSSAQATPASVITVAEAPGANPNYIFPYMQCAYYSSSNINQLQRLMFRPLYWYGLGSSTALVRALSLANAPVFNKSDTVVTFSTKGWRFSDGQPVNGRSVMFFLNLWTSDPTNFCAYEPGHGIPDEVRTAVATGNTVRVTFATPVNPSWILGNFLNLVTPLPDRWDRTSSQTRGGCATGVLRAPSTIQACKAVDAYLQSLASNTSTFTNAFWRSGVDGPWTLSSFDSSGNATFNANRSYSGPQRPMVAKLREVAYQSLADQLRDLVSGKLDIANLGRSTLVSASATTGVAPGALATIAKKYNLRPAAPWSINYLPFNFNAADPKAAIVAQPYIRAAMQEAIDQPTIIKSVFNAFAVPGLGPLPSGATSPLGHRVASPYAYDLSAARDLLTSHGWAMQGGVMTCASPGAGPQHCGAGVLSGDTIAFKLATTGDSEPLGRVLDIEIAAWRSIGIIVTPQNDTYDAVISDCGNTAGFELCAWTSGWDFRPSTYPTGEDLFTTGGTFDVGGYSNPVMTKLINDSLHTKTSLAGYSQYVGQQVPVLLEPTEMLLLESRKTLKSAVALVPNPLGSFTPEYFH